MATIHRESGMPKPTAAQQTLIDKWDREQRLISNHMEDDGTIRTTVMDGHERRILIVDKNGRHKPAPGERVIREQLPDGTPVNVTVTDSRKGK